MTGTVTETHVAAIRHGLAALDGATRIGVARRPTEQFHDAVAENVRELGPPTDLLDAAERRRDDFAMAGMCDAGAHNAAWEELDVEERYREFLATDAAASAALDRLRERIRSGEDVALVCFETADKRCHRHALRDVLVGPP